MANETSTNPLDAMTAVDWRRAYEAVQRQYDETMLYARQYQMYREYQLIRDSMAPLFGSPPLDEDLRVTPGL